MMVAGKERIANELTCELIQHSFDHLAVRRTSEYTPVLTLTAISTDQPYYEAVVGTLVWDKVFVPQSVQETFEGLSDNVKDIEGYYFSKTIGCAWALDDDLVRRHGLRYSLCFLRWASDDDKTAEKMLVTTNGIEVRPDPLHPDSIRSYFDAARPYLDELFSQIDSYVFRL